MYIEREVFSNSFGPERHSERKNPMRDLNDFVSKYNIQDRIVSISESRIIDAISRQETVYITLFYKE